MKIIKRNGQRVRFDKQKIVNAITKASNEQAEDSKLLDSQIYAIADVIEHRLLKLNQEVTVEAIQEMVIDELIALGKPYAELTKAYAIYRYNHELRRKANSTDDAILGLIHCTNKEAMDENSNKNALIAATQRDLIAGEVSRDLTKRVLLPEKLAKAHEEGIYHFHDTDYFIQPIFNCCLINIQDMLDNGTCINGKMIESPKSFQVACTVMTQIIAAVASSQYGGQSVDIRHLAKYIRKAKEKIEKQTRETAPDLNTETFNALVNARLKDEVKAGVQTIQYQINTLMTTNGQSPFVTLFMWLKEDEYIEETAMLIEEILKQRIQGIKNQHGVYVTPSFPKLIYVLDEHNCLKGGKYDYLTKLAVECSAKRMYPDYISAKKMRENYEGEVFSCINYCA